MTHVNLLAVAAGAGRGRRRGRAGRAWSRSAHKAA